MSRKAARAPLLDRLIVCRGPTGYKAEGANVCAADLNIEGCEEAAKQMIAQGKENGPYKILNVGSILSRQAFDDVVPFLACLNLLFSVIPQVCLKSATQYVASLVEHGLQPSQEGET
ncbi:hypothetical protein [Halomonas sp. A11-A]|uniref:hypothetical protein n=1 Tax=Halomonas sp. A11-A TaxID=2183985 RepID=UPI00215B3383|nr:hypothetical protein [Halomonas sp. A11-A]